MSWVTACSISRGDIKFTASRNRFPYILSFCAHKKMYPIHFTLVDPESRQVLYDNTNDRYIESLGVGFDVTKSITVTIQALARTSSENEVEHSVGCVGLLIQYKNYDAKKVNLKMQ
jgi:hypothetical protein